jgi:hypothetical protein
VSTSATAFARAVAVALAAHSSFSLAWFCFFVSRAALPAQRTHRDRFFAVKVVGSVGKPT